MAEHTTTRLAELRELTRIRTLVFLRVPEAVFWVFVFPMVLAAVLGFAFQSSGPAPSRIGFLEDDAALAAGLEGVDGLELVRFDVDEDARRALRAGKVDALLRPGEKSGEGGGGGASLRLDPMRPESELARLRVLVARGELDPALVEVQAVTERGSRYVDFLFPGLIGMNLMGTGLWAIGFAIAELRQRKVLKRLMVTPMRRSSFQASFLLSRLVFLVLEVFALTAFGAWVLDVPLHGGLFQYGLVCLLGAISFAGLGLLAASRVKTIEGASGMLNLVMMPMWLGSGVFFSYERFPEVIHPLLRLLPLTALNDALRATMLEGAGPLAILPEVGVLAAWTVVPFLLALRLFRWE